MLKVFFLIFEPDVAWEKISQARRGLVFISVFHLLPLVALATVAEGWGLLNWGKWQPRFSRTKVFTDLQPVIHFDARGFLSISVAASYSQRRWRCDTHSRPPRFVMSRGGRLICMTGALGVSKT